MKEFFQGKGRDPKPIYAPLFFAFTSISVLYVWEATDSINDFLTVCSGPLFIFVFHFKITPIGDPRLFYDILRILSVCFYLLFSLALFGRTKDIWKGYGQIIFQSIVLIIWLLLGGVSLVLVYPNT
ncbi:MAG: hypothetical protein MPJ24_11925 [Pirellulaceae bacterium]|nr:hypothetical protein [Pirellulaceae bacterium]